MIIKIFALMVSLGMARFDAMINPNELTIIEFDGGEIKVDQDYEDYYIRPEIGGGDKGIIKLTSNIFDRGMFLKVCDV